MVIVLFMFLIIGVGCLILFFELEDETLSMFSMFVFILAAIFSVAWIITIIKSHNKADFYNAVYGSKLTAEEVFWNDDFIKSNIIGERKNYNLNMRHEDE